MNKLAFPMGHVYANFELFPLKYVVFFFRGEFFLTSNNVICIWTFMRLRSGRTLVEMILPKNMPHPKNNASGAE